jgi:hypothetical protein
MRFYEGSQLQIMIKIIRTQKICFKYTKEPEKHEIKKIY